MSARRMLDALISGSHDPELLADLAKGSLRKKIPAQREALRGRFTGHHPLLIGQMPAQIDFLDETIATLSAQIEELTRPFSRELELLDTIPGIDRQAAEMLLAEIRPDMSRFPTDAHLPSWGGMCPARPARVRRQRALQPDPQRVRVAAGNPDRVRQGVRAHQRHLPVRAITGSRAAAGTPKRLSRPPTRSSLPPTTSSTKAFPTTSSAKRCSTAATPRTPNATAAASSTNSNALATRSLSSRYRRPPDLTPPRRWKLFSIQFSWAAPAGAGENGMRCLTPGSAGTSRRGAGFRAEL